MRTRGRTREGEGGPICDGGPPPQSLDVTGDGMVLPPLTPVAGDVTAGGQLNPKT